MSGCCVLADHGINSTKHGHKCCSHGQGVREIESSKDSGRGVPSLSRHGVTFMSFAQSLCGHLKGSRDVVFRISTRHSSHSCAAVLFCSLLPQMQWQP
jgi:hypothetical protein